MENPKQLQHYVEEAMEFESYYNDSDTEEENTVFEEYELD